MNRRKSLGELRWPSSPEFVSVAESFKKGCTARMLGFVWTAYDALHDTVLSKVDLSAPTDDLERSITQYLEPEIHKVMDSGLPFYVQHGTFEHESRLPAPAQPPAYDVAFVLYENRRTAWPIEAKVLRTEGDLASYVKDIRDEFLTCRYAPFSSEGGMMAYLLSGDPQASFLGISEKVPCTLKPHPGFPNRKHRTSEHTRTVPAGKCYPSAFKCHHLILCLSQRSQAA